MLVLVVFIKCIIIFISSGDMWCARKGGCSVGRSSQLVLYRTILYDLV